MKILVACADYPSDTGNALQFVHVRNKCYLKAGLDITVLNFSCKEGYIHEGIKVITLSEAKKNIEVYDILISHAPNLRNHYKFIKRYGNFFRRKLFFFHGHEIVKINVVYPEPYPFKKKGLWRYLIQSVYDYVKLYVWRVYFNKGDNNDLLIFVSTSLMKDFFTFTKVQKHKVEDRCRVIYNGVGEVFEKKCYDQFSYKKYDFLTIRSDIDNSVYCIDILTEIAKQNPEKRFLLIGKGNYFQYNRKPFNLVHINKSMKQEELIKYIDESSYALMPTRRDSQGVMACELATYGIPLLTSDLPVCKEVFSGFKNVKLASDKELLNMAENGLQQINKNGEKCEKFFLRNTVLKEIGILSSF